MYMRHPNHTFSQVGISRTICQLEDSEAVNPTLSWNNLEVSSTAIAFGWPERFFGPCESDSHLIWDGKNYSIIYLQPCSAFHEVSLSHLS